MRLLVVAKKEFSDILTSKRFIALLAAMVFFYLTSVFQMLSYAFTYGSLDVKQMVIFAGNTTMSVVGAIFGIALGFDLITREKEKGTLRTLLSHPIYRDEIVLGKAVGALFAILLALFIIILFIIGSAMFFGYTPKIEDLYILIKFYLITVAYLYTFFALSFLFSAIFKSSATALTTSLVVFVVISLILPIYSFMIVGMILGPPPKPPGIQTPLVDDSGATTPMVIDIENDPEWRSYREESQKYYAKMQEIISAIMLFSPTASYSMLISAVTAGGMLEYFPAIDVYKISLSFIILPIVLFVLAYAKFVREEL